MTAIIIAFATALSSQDPEESGRTTTADVTFAFVAQQGWSLRILSEGDFRDVVESRLTRDTQPRLLTTDWRLSRSAEVPTSNIGVAFPRVEPIKIEGSIVLRPDGKYTVFFGRIDYWDDTQSWRIEFTDNKVRTSGLGGRDKWTGTRAEWRRRLESLEDAAIEQYLSAVTPQLDETPPPRAGKVPIITADAGRRLFVTCSLEEQLAAFLMARVAGAVLDQKLWPAECAKYPPAVIQMARSMLERLLLQCSDELAPSAARADGRRRVEGQAWDFRGRAVPWFQWEDGSSWLAGMEEPRRRLAELAEQSRTNGGIGVAAWQEAVDREVRQLQQNARVVVPGRMPALTDALLPRILSIKKGSYDYTEEICLDGKVKSSDVRTQGLAPEVEVAFFQSGANTWKIARARIETWYVGKIKRK
ncbi:MAG: hypothetical protein HYY16_15175 [Planctomycetes bacterium]|nr:hypothetical protein [Planctomycetota bacterium]